MDAGPERPHLGRSFSLLRRAPRPDRGVLISEGGRWREAGARVRRGGRGDLARNAFGFLFRRLFRRIPSATGQRVGPPLFSLSL